VVRTSRYDVGSWFADQPEVTTNWGKILGFQIVGGIGLGMNFEGPLLALQAIVGVENTATATATIGFVRTLSTAILVVIGTSRVPESDDNKGIPIGCRSGKQVASQVSGGAMANTEIIDTLPLDQKLVA
jgi:hypothetical protein